MNIVILAAGMGKRMNSRLPKVLQPLAGMPMLGHVLASVKKETRSEKQESPLPDFVLPASQPAHSRKPNPLTMMIM